MKILFYTSCKAIAIKRSTERATVFFASALSRCYGCECCSAYSVEERALCESERGLRIDADRGAAIWSNAGCIRFPCLDSGDRFRRVEQKVRSVPKCECLRESCSRAHWGCGIASRYGLVCHVGHRAFLFGGGY